MKESLVLDSMSGDPMPKPYSGDLRARVIGDIVSGASRRAAAEYYGISPSVVVIWAQRFETTGSVAAKPSGGSTSPLEKHAEFLLALIAKQPDLTLDEIVAAMNKRGIPGSRSAVWRFFARRNISFKKNFVRVGAKARRRGARADGGCESKACLTRPDWCLSTKRGRTPAWFGFEAAADAENG